MNLKRTRAIVSLICGLASGITCVPLLSRMFSGQVSTGRGIEFDCLTAAILGGVSFTGGEGSVFGLVTGVPTTAVLNNAIQLGGLPDFRQNLVKGAALRIAVGFDTYQKRGKGREAIAHVTG